MGKKRKGGHESEREERGRTVEGGTPKDAPREAADSREDAGWSQPESSAQKHDSPPEQIPEEG